MPGWRPDLLERFWIRCSQRIAAVRDVVRALVGQEEREGRLDQLTDLVKRTWTGGAEEGLEFGKGHLDRIEVGTVGREKPQPRARLFDRDPHLGLLVHGEVIEHHDVAGAQRRDQDLLDVRAERHRIDRAVEDGGGGQGCRSQGRDQRVRLPMPAGRVVDSARAARTARIATQEIRRDARLVDKDERPRVVQGLRVAPAPPFSGDVGASLFAGVYRFF